VLCLTASGVSHNPPLAASRREHQTNNGPFMRSDYTYFTDLFWLFLKEEICVIRVICVGSVLVPVTPDNNGNTDYENL
jgi:hypothetical protein